MRLVVAGGGTGGHIYPGIAVAEEVRQRGGEVVFFGCERGLETRLVPAAGFPLCIVPARGFVRGRPLQNLGAAWSNARGVLEARRRLATFRPDVVLGMGGFASFAASAAAPMLGIPLVLHEQNAVPGLANRVLGRVASMTLTSWGTAGVAERERTRRVGLPVRAAFRRMDRAAARRTARAALGISEDEPVVVAFGGSRGALSINRALAAWMGSPGWRRCAEQGALLIWATGGDHLESFRHAATQGGERVRIVPYIEDMPALLPAADLAVTRAGAMTLAELAACGIPSVLVPYPHATADHQTANARALVEAGASTLVADAHLAESLGPEIERLLAEPALRRSMGEAAAALGNPGAATEIADILERLSMDSPSSSGRVRPA